MASRTFREVFRHAHKETFNWFPGHMKKGMRLMQQRLRSIDGIIELHDARAPLSGRNDLFRQNLSLVRPHLLLLNKKDLADLTRQEQVVRRLKEQGVSEVFYTDCLRDQDETVKQIMPKMVDMIKTGQRYLTPNMKASSYTLMIIGVPNVGKSSFINAVRRVFTKRAKAAHVGAMPGITRAVQNVITVSEKPRIDVIDTPGIAHPSIKSPDDAMKLALCHIMDDVLVGEELIVDYMLFWFNRRGDFRVHRISQDPEFPFGCSKNTKDLP
ncbi:mitochondrial ribosome-associated GTPase 1-like isoform X2 [Paramacrobiotus metropolitanus]|uniref:mitochondrial ribosome-associated GTPase 1-like isoform X2 n=1 Tax=Paramacrobiotus metropolitanus TaxID=2943436 RepID=UPI002445B197|nr:mitochondrial ribosome-associated GTPase 1-like isoform X2 [Paramacrobiotus metropolitanus]